MPWPSAQASRAGVQRQVLSDPSVARPLAVRAEELRAKTVRKSREVRNFACSRQVSFQVYGAR
jgi:hypothetical protein